eukprot:TRINITY_DN333_c0_g1_i2.p1 TRINITY_DN333_c0_g1~~TRINITY_DN333_c0_g1_i2.p1  ORF type:complete len:567 (+),score=156.85 TRINITY_DN333_c0_g1_i2:59-1759(+)
MLLVAILFFLGYANCQVQQAVAVLNPTSTAYSGVSATVTFNCNINASGCNVTIVASGIQYDGPHGIHIHVFGDLRGVMNFSDSARNPNSTVAGGLSVGSHWDPDNTTVHACETNTSIAHHEGDTGNWDVINGTINQTKYIDYLWVSGNRSIIGRGLVLHNTTDDCANILSAGARIAFGVIGIASGTNNTASATSTVTEAVCVLQGTAVCNTSTTNCNLTNAGLVYFTQDGEYVHASVEIINLYAPWGFHLHFYGDLRNPTDGSSVGGHYNPDSYWHGLPTVNNSRHLGDFGNIQSFMNGSGYYNYTPTYARPWKVSDIVGRAVIIHAKVDQGNAMCPGRNSATYLGDSGARPLWCVIGLPNLLANPAYLPKPYFPPGLVINNTFSDFPCPDNTTSAPTNAPVAAPTNGTAPVDPPTNGTAPVAAPTNSTPVSPPTNGTAPVAAPTNSTPVSPPTNGTAPVAAPTNSTPVNPPTNGTAPVAAPTNSTPVNPPTNGTAPVANSTPGAPSTAPGAPSTAPGAPGAPVTAPSAAPGSAPTPVRAPTRSSDSAHVVVSFLLCFALILTYLL